MDLIIILIVVSYFALACLNLRWAFVLLLVVLPGYMVRFSFFGVPLTLLEVMILTLFGVFLYKERRKIGRNIGLALERRLGLKKVSYPFSFSIFGILISALIGVVVAGFSNESLGVLKAYFVEPIMLYVVLVNVVGRETGKLRSEVVVLALGVLAMCLSLVAFVQKFSGLWMPLEWIEVGRVTSVYSYPNALGLFLGPIVLLLIGLFFDRGAKRALIELIGEEKSEKYYLAFRGWLAVSVVTSVLAIYFAKSEGALLGVLAGVLVFGLFYSKKARVVTVIAVFVGCVSLFFLQANNEKVKKKLMFEDLSGVIRLIGWKETVLILKDGYWLAGAGLSGFQEAVRPVHEPGFFYNFSDDPDFRRKIVIFDDRYKAEHWQPLEVYMYPHNIVLNFWVELGLLGVVMFGFLIFQYVVSALCLIKSDKEGRGILLGLLGAMIAVIVHGMVDVPYFKNDLAVLFWVLVGLLGVYKLNKK